MIMTALVIKKTRNKILFPLTALTPAVEAIKHPKKILIFLFIMIY